MLAVGRRKCFFPWSLADLEGDCSLIGVKASFVRRPRILSVGQKHQKLHEKNCYCWVPTGDGQ